jgi:hypothetical protein
VWFHVGDVADVEEVEQFVALASFHANRRGGGKPMTVSNELDQQKESILKAFRTAIRTKHALRADKEIQYRLPEIEEFIDKALATGEAPPELNPAEVFEVADE